MACHVIVTLRINPLPRHAFVTLCANMLILSALQLTSWTQPYTSGFDTDLLGVAEGAKSRRGSAGVHQPSQPLRTDTQVEAIWKKPVHSLDPRRVVTHAEPISGTTDKMVWLSLRDFAGVGSAREGTADCDSRSQLDLRDFVPGFSFASSLPPAAALHLDRGNPASVEHLRHTEVGWPRRGSSAEFRVCA